ncbi:hypothetical protein ABH932_002578 [Streptacidiphilus sp. MAP5-52]
MDLEAANPLKPMIVRIHFRAAIFQDRLVDLVNAGETS